MERSDEDSDVAELNRVRCDDGRSMNNFVKPEPSSFRFEPIPVAPYRKLKFRMAQSRRVEFNGNRPGFSRR
jgi:hypothetical protein